MKDDYSAYITPTKLPGEMIDELARNTDKDVKQVFLEVTNILVERCFGPDVLSLKDRLIEIFPELDGQLLFASTQTRSLKIVLDIAKLNKVNREQESRLIFEAAFIVLMYIHIVRNTQMITPPHVKFYESYDDLLGYFGDSREFQYLDISDTEKKKLVCFANIMKVALVLMQKPKKAHLLDLVTRIAEGRSVKYITGSGQTALTARRVQIFQYESGIKPTPRPPRKNFKNEDGTITKSASYCSDLTNEDKYSNAYMQSEYGRMISPSFASNESFDNFGDRDSNTSEDELSFMEASEILSRMSNSNSFAPTLKKKKSKKNGMEQPTVENKRNDVKEEVSPTLQPLSLGAPSTRNPNYVVPVPEIYSYFPLPYLTVLQNPTTVNPTTANVENQSSMMGMMKMNYNNKPPPFVYPHLSQPPLISANSITNNNSNNNITNNNNRNENLLTNNNDDDVNRPQKFARLASDRQAFVV